MTNENHYSCLTHSTGDSHRAYDLAFIAKNSLCPEDFFAFSGVAIDLENVKLAIVCSKFVRQADRVTRVAYHSRGEQLFG